jgi:exopolysaccharide biosynthesis polyprenyl glycosylphosphotransferase
VVGGVSLTPWALLGIPAMLILSKLFGLYDRDENRLQKSTLEEVPGLLALATLVTLLASLCDGAITDGRLTEPAILTIWVALSGLLVLGRVASRGFVDRVVRPERCVLVGDPLTTADVARKVDFLDLNVEIVATLPARALPDPRDGLNGDAGDAFLRRVAPVIDLERAHRVILASGPWPAEHLLHTVSDLMSSGVKVSVVPSTARLASLSYEVDQLPGMAMLGMKRFGISRSSQIIKRAFDLVVSSVVLVLLSPLMAAIALAIRLDSRGPALYRQRRIGKNGQEFEMLKFRSMVAGAHQHRDELRHLNRVDGLFKIPEDPRVTRVGRVIRRRSADELPQLLNVFRGQMSLVGPRPLVPAEDARVEGRFRHRLNVRPGITGHWQTLGAWRIPIQDMVVIDYLYAANWSLWTDLKLLARTIPFIASARGA